MLPFSGKADHLFRTEEILGGRCSPRAKVPISWTNAPRESVDAQQIMGWLLLRVDDFVISVPCDLTVGHFWFSPRSFVGQILW